MTFLPRKPALLATALIASGGAWAAFAHHSPVDPLSFACGVGITSQGGLLHVEALLQSDEDISGTYQLEAHRRGARLSQGGPFELPDGGSLSLSSFTLNGPAAGLETTLTLTIGNTVYACPETL